MNKFLISSKPIEVSEYKDYKLATFLISVLDEYNANGVLIPKDVGEKYHETIVGFPIVAKLITDSDNNPIDFRGHELTKNRDGYRFNTMPIGSVLKSYIEDRLIDGYEGVKSCIMIQAKLWSGRFPEYFEVLDELWAEGNISSSWELSVEKSEPTVKGKILKAFSFIGNCLLGRDVEGAVNGAGMIEYAENYNDNSDEIKLAKALSIDCLDDKEVKEMEQENKDIVTSESEEVVETIGEEIAEGEVVESSAENVEVSAITFEDVEKELNKWVNEKEIYGYIHHTFIDEKYFLTHNWKMKSLEFYKFDYDVINNEVTINETPEKVTLVVDITNVNQTIASKDEEIIKINAEMGALKAKLSELTEIKNQYDEMIAKKKECERAEQIKAFREKAISSGYITEGEIESSEEISIIISELDEVKLNAIIVDRIIKSNASTKVEKAEIENDEKININLSSVETEKEKTYSVKDYRDAIKSYIQ